MNHPYIYELISSIISVKGGKTLPQRIENIKVPAKTDLNKNKRITTIYDLVTSDKTNILDIKYNYTYVKKMTNFTMNLANLIQSKLSRSIGSSTV